MNRTNFIQGQGGGIIEPMTHFQNAVADAFAMLLSMANPNVAYFISGCASSAQEVNGEVTVSIEAGVAALNGEPFRVEAHNIIRTVSEVAWLEVDEVYVDVTPVQTLGGASEGNQVQRTLVLKKGDNFPAVGLHVPLNAPTQVEILADKLASRLLRVGSIYMIDVNDIPVIPANFSETGLGLPGTVAEGIALCNGNNGTPDYRHLVPMGATLSAFSVGAPPLADGVDVGATYVPGSTVGEHEHELTEGELPQITLTYDKPNVIPGDADLSGNANSNNRGVTPTDLIFGGDEAHNNIQPSFVTVFVKVVS